MDPAEGRSVPATQRSSVLLPEPFGPTSATASPGTDLRVDAGENSDFAERAAQPD